jgi:DNA-binding winged helix-turn-helix (wHTH) protein
VVRYRFSEFTLSPQRRLLLREGREVPLIPRYFDLLLLLIERRREAVHRREIFDRVWGDISVSDSALSQAVRTIRRTLGDDTQEPRFIRTVSRHGYQFVFPDVIEEQEEGDAAVAATAAGSETRRAARRTSKTLSGASAGGALAGMFAGGVGGLILAAAPDSTAPIAIAPVLAVIGGGCGASAGAGVGAGIGAVETAAPAHRVLALTCGAALGGGGVGLVVEWLARWSLAALFGLDIAIGGGVEGLVIGSAVGLGYAIAPRSKLTIALMCGMAGLALNLAGRPLVGGTINVIAHAAEGSRATLAPLGRLVGEPDFGPVSSAILAFGEAATFGLGLAYGLLARGRAVGSGTGTTNSDRRE